MSMLRWRKVRVAQIAPNVRDEFERYGELVLAHALATLSPVTPPVTELANLFNQHRTELLAWLTERRDIDQRKADRIEAVEVGILVFVVFGVVIDFLLLVTGNK
jgi:hypothetical protein